jgi:HEAT repeat protein
MLPEPGGGIAAWLLAGFEASGTSVLVAACQSPNSLQRIHVSSALQMIKDPSLVEPLITLLKDERQRVRLNAIHAAVRNWDPRFTEAFLALFHDPCAEIRQEAIIPLDQCEATNLLPACMALLRDLDAEVQFRALDTLSRLRQDTVPRADLLRLLGSERVDTVNRALTMLYRRWPPDWSVPSLYLATRFRAPSVTNELSSAEAAPLTTNRLTMARLMGLKILRRNADAQAVTLTLPLLRDPNSFVRDRAVDLLRTVSAQDIPQTDPAKWEQWWAANKASFIARKPTE